jgi:hypothetical protein
MAHVMYNLEQRIYIYYCYAEQIHTNHARKKFRLPDTTFLSGNTISKLVQKVRTHGILIEKKPLKINRVLTTEKLDDTVVD